MGQLSERAEEKMELLHDLLDYPPKGEHIKESVVDDYHTCLLVLAKEFDVNLGEFFIPQEEITHRDITPPGMFVLAGPSHQEETPEREKLYSQHATVPKERFERQLRLAVKRVDRLAAGEPREQVMLEQKVDEPRRTERRTLFIGSSKEGLPIAKAIQANLPSSVEPILWDQGVFGLSGGTLESLEKVKGTFDYAVLVLTPDDLIIKRDETKNTARDNVIFELGFFMGGLGRDKTFMVYSQDDKIDLPSDLAGITAATFIRPAKGTLRSALGKVCTLLEEAMGLT